MPHLAYSVEREYNVPVEAMWQAWTDAAALESWYHPVHLATVPGSVTSDVAVGGLWTVGVDVPEFGFVSWFYGRYTNVVPMSRLEHTMHYTQSAEEFAERDESTPFHEIVVEIKERGGRTRVRFSQFGEMPVEQADLARAGMESYFDSLRDYLQPDQYQPMDQGSAG